MAHIFDGNFRPGDMLSPGMNDYLQKPAGLSRFIDTLSDVKSERMDW